jgi:LCP family protein required for cell wall assembly
MTDPTEQVPDEVEARIAEALRSARTDSRLTVRPWSDGPTRIARASRRKRVRHGAIAITSVAALVLATAGGADLYLNRKLNAIQSASLGAAAVPGVPPVKGKGHLTAKPKAGQPFTVLILGTDSRVGTGAEYGTNADACQCSDTIMLARVDPQTAKVSLLSIPRDSRVNITGKNAIGKINSAFGRGPDNSVATIEAALHIPINHWMVLDLAGFKSIVNAIGGIKLDFPYPIKDKNAGLNVTTTGCQTVTGDEALAISRSRELQYFSDGKWTYDPTWENGRQRREQILMRVMAAHTVKASLSNPLTALKVVDTFTSNNRLAIDNQVSVSELVDLAGDFAGFDAAAMKTFSLPTVTTVFNVPGVGKQDFEVLQPTADTATIQAWYDAVLATPKASASTSTGPTASGSPTTAAKPATTAATPTSVAPANPTTAAPTASGGTAAATTIAPNQPAPFDPRPCS